MAFLRYYSSRVASHGHESKELPNHVPPPACAAVGVYPQPGVHPSGRVFSVGRACCVPRGFSGPAAVGVCDTSTAALMAATAPLVWPPIKTAQLRIDASHEHVAALFCSHATLRDLNGRGALKSNRLTGTGTIRLHHHWPPTLCDSTRCVPRRMVPSLWHVQPLARHSVVRCSFTPGVLTDSPMFHAPATALRFG